jgi:2-oxoglutarate ferredoxin oxidoreductase subunit alpha
MHSLSRSFPAYGGMVHQAEDEISAIGAMLGGYYSGIPSITATSGPGLSLKQEFIGLSYASEIPGIIVDVQRGGPSTGLPTRTEQTDLFAAAFGAHGDSAKVVISVANVEDCFYVPHLARYFAEVLRMPVIILSDYITSVSYRVLDKLPVYELDSVQDISKDILDRFYIDQLPEKIEMVKDNQAVPGEDGGMRRVTGLNTDTTGNVVYTSDSNQRSHDVRNEKLHHVRRALRQPELIGDDSGDLLIVGWGSSRGVMEEAVNLARKEGLKVSALHLKIVYPLPLSLKDIFKNFKRVVTTEVAYADELKPTEFAMMLRSETLVDVGVGIAQATGRPLKPKSVLARIKELV